MTYMLWREVRIKDTNFNAFYIEIIFVTLGEMMWSREKNVGEEAIT